MIAANDTLIAGLAGLKRAPLALAVLALVALGLVAVRADGGDDDRAAAGSVNAYRATKGLARLATDAGLDTDARRWAEHLADTDSLSHDRLDLGNWTTMGENVGRGVSAEVVQRAFEASPTHEHNLAGAYTHLGIDVAGRGDVVWVVQRFATRSVPVTAPPTTLAPTTTTVTLAPVLLCRRAGRATGGRR
jgi:hypothetical protein